MTIMSQVLVPRIFTSVPSRIPAPTAPMCASNAPAAIAMPGFSPSFFAHSAESRPAGRSAGTAFS